MSCVTRFVLEKRRYYIHSNWDNSGFDLSITDGRFAWNFRADETFVESKLKPRGMDSRQFLDELRQGLTKQDVAQKKFTYSATEVASGNLRFEWTIRIGSQAAAEDPLKLMGSLELVRLSAPATQEFVQTCLDRLIDLCTTLEKDNEELRDQHSELRNQRGQAVGKLARLDEDKQRMETELYKKFVMLLNEKKKKIKELKAQVDVAAARAREAEATARLRRTAAGSPSDSDPDQEDAVSSLDGEHDFSPAENDEHYSPTPTSQYLSLSQSELGMTSGSASFQHARPVSTASLDDLAPGLEERIPTRVRKRLRADFAEPPPAMSFHNEFMPPPPALSRSEQILSSRQQNQVSEPDPESLIRAALDAESPNG